MTARVSLLLLVIIALSCAASAAPPVISIGPMDFTVRVTPGHRVAWTALGRVGVATDADRDGVVHVDQPAGSVIAADLETGEWSVAARYGPASESQLPAGSILPGPTGAYTEMQFPALDRAGFLWVRPGVAAWGGCCGSAHTARSDALMISNTGRMKPLDTAPPTPGSFERGDRLLVLGDSGAFTGVVDGQLDAPRTPGAIAFFHERSSGGEGTSVMPMVIRTGGTEGTVTVRCCASTGTPVDGTDFTIPPHDITFGPGEVLDRTTIALPDDDAFNDAPRVVRVRLQEGSGGASVSAQELPISITDNDPPPVFGFGDLAASVAERDGPWLLAVPVTLTGRWRGPVQARLSSGTTEIPLVFAEGQSQVIGEIPITGNTAPNREVMLELRVRSVFGRIAEVNRRITIVDDDLAQVLPIDDLTAREGDFHLPVVIRADFDPSAAASLTVTTADGTAKAGEDYTAVSQTLSVSRSSSTVYVPIRNDGTAETPETFYLDITNATGPILPPARTRIAVTIVDNDVAATGLVIDPVSVQEQDSGTQRVPVRVRLAAAMDSVFDVDLSLEEGTARAAADYFGLSREILRFEAGQTEHVVTVTITGDISDEPDETFAVVARQDGVVRARGIVTIVDNDGAFRFLSADDAGVREGTGAPVAAVFRVTISPAPDAPATVAYKTIDGTATAGADYVAQSGTLSFGVGETVKEVRVEVTGDAQVEPDERFTLRLSNATGAYIHRDVATAVIFDDDTSAPAIVLGDVAVAEGDAGQQQVPVHVRLATAAPETVTLAIVTTGAGTAQPHADYLPFTQTLSFAPGETEKTVPVIIVGDLQDEPDETLELAVSERGVVKATSMVTIRNDDGPVGLLSVADASVMEKNTSRWLTFRVTMSAPAARAVSVGYTTADGTARAGVDYAFANSTLHFVPGEMSRDVRVEVFGDGATEPEETLWLRLSNAVGATLLRAEALGTIYDDDQVVVLPTLSVSDVSVTETNDWSTATFTLTLSEAAATAASVRYRTLNETATAPSDFEHASGVMTFRPGEKSRTISVRIAGDTAVEPAETFRLELSDAAGAILENAAATCTIANDDAGKRRAARH